MLELACRTQVLAQSTGRRLFTFSDEEAAQLVPRSTSKESRRHFDAMLATIETRMGTDPHLPQWPAIGTDVIAVELGTLIAVGVAIVAWVRRRAQGAVLALAILGFSWFALVAAMTEAGFAGNQRYLMVTTAAVSVLGGIGAVAVHQMRLGGPPALAAIRDLDQVHERVHVALARISQDRCGQMLRFRVMRGHEEILPVRWRSMMP